MKDYYIIEIEFQNVKKVAVEFENSTNIFKMLI